MTHPHEESLRKGYDAFTRGDLDAFRSLWTEDIVWHVAGRSPLSRDYEGIDAVLGYFATLFEMTDGTVRVELHDVVAGERHSVALHRATGQRGGRTLDTDAVLVTHWRDGKTSEVWETHRDQYATDELFS